MLYMVDVESKDGADTGPLSQWAREMFGFEADATQTRVLDSRSKRGILNCTRQWGKSTVAALKAVHRGYMAAGSLTLVVTPSARQSAELVRKAGRFVAEMGDAVTADGDNEHSLKLPNGSRIVGLPGKESTVRGFSAVSLLVVDEAARVSDELYRAVRPMLAVSGGELWLMSTPYGKQGFFWEEWSGRARGWERVRVTGPECPRIPPEFLAEERQTLGERWFRQEYLCEFEEVEGAVFEAEVIEGAFGSLRSRGRGPVSRG
jgi:hypothetical protein